MGWQLATCITGKIEIFVLHTGIEILEMLVQFSDLVGMNLTERKS